MPPTAPVTPLVVFVDVTDTVATHWRAGIQRVVAQLVERLAADERLEVVPVVWLESLPGFRSLTSDEVVRLAPDGAVPNGHVVPGGPVSGSRLRPVMGRLRPLLGRLRRALVAVSVAVGVEPLLRRFRRRVLRSTRDRHLVPLEVVPAAGSVLFEVDTVWNNTWVDRAALYRELAGRGVHLAALVYDLLPQQHPEWFEASLVEVSNRTIAAQAAHAELVLAISQDTAASFSEWARRHATSPPAPRVISLGADAAAPNRGAGASRSTELPAELAGARYVLTVGTVEPRKNHATLLEAFEQVWERQPDSHLVVVGRPGWHNDDVLARLAAHPRAGRRLHWYRGAGDDLLATLYSHARVVAVASITEGYGLPVIEGLARGVPVLSSDGGALVEAGGELVEHLPATDVAAWAEALGRYLGDDDLVASRRAALAGYRAPTWAGTARQVADLLVERFAPGAD